MGLCYSALHSFPYSGALMKYSRRLLMLLVLFPLLSCMHRISVHPSPIGRAAALRDRREFDAAIALLRSYVAEHPENAHAQFLLGETLYWVGDWSGAERHFRRAIEIDPAEPEARRQLEEIRQVTTPWISFDANYRKDDQPLRRSAAEIEAGLFLTPLQRLVFRADPQQFEPAQHGFSLSGDVGWLAYWPGLS